MGGGSASSPATSASGLAPVRVGGDIREPKKIRDVKPVYPEDALANRIQGIVILEAVIGLDGSVESAQGVAIEFRSSTRPPWTRCGNGSSRRRC